MFVGCRGGPGFHHPCVLVPAGRSRVAHRRARARLATGFDTRSTRGGFTRILLELLEFTRTFPTSEAIFGRMPGFLGVGTAFFGFFEEF